ncbi:MAG: hypothetical protein IJ306_09400 [Oscillospiraceae bacterium]|nr:hypothetical protein [Oscillospiraceae bacterium]
MDNKPKKALFAITSICVMITILVAFGFFSKDTEDTVMDIIVGIVAIISGIGSVFVGIASIFSTSLDNVREYFATGDTKEMGEARKVLYNYRYIKIKYGKSIFDDDFDLWIQQPKIQSDGFIMPAGKDEILAAASVCMNFFQMWGLLQNKGFLPIWVFETASGYSIIKLHQAMEDILYVRRETNPFYGQQFSWLCARILKKYKKAIAQCIKSEKEYIVQKLGISEEKAAKWLEDEIANNKKFGIKS